MDNRLMEEFLPIKEDIAARWPAGAGEIIESKNPEMHQRMIQLMDFLEKMMVRGADTKTERKQFTAALAAWKRIHELGIEYARRHLSLTKQKIV